MVAPKIADFAAIKQLSSAKITADIEHSSLSCIEI